MIRKDLVSRAASILSKKRVRKLVPAIKSKLYIRDDEGHESQFVVKHEQRGYLLNEADVNAVLDALLEALVSIIKDGEDITLYGIGTLGHQYWSPRPINFVDGSGKKMIEGHYIAKFTPGKYIKEALKIYEDSLEDGGGTVINDSEDGTNGD